ncbi:MAG TPA: hypothetical protein VGJ25_03735 [Gaiellaceae bacterium]
MRIRVAAAALAAAAGLSALTAWVLEWPFEKAVYLAPIIVAFFGCALGILVFWGRVAYVQVRESRNPRLIVALAVGLLALIALLTVLGVELPREGG